MNDYALNLYYEGLTEQNRIDEPVSLVKEYGLPYPFIGVSYDAAAHGLPAHAEGLSMNDPITLASVFRVMTNLAYQEW